MNAPKTPEHEQERLAALEAYAVLDTPPEEAFDELTQLASRLCGTPIALVSLVDAHRQWFKSRVGLDAEETPREVSFCGHAILAPEDVFIVPDSHVDRRFADNPLVTGDPDVRFYAGAPLVDPEGHAVGTLCVIDHQPRELSAEQRSILATLARQVVGQLELRRTSKLLASALDSATAAARAKSAFLANMSHEIRTPMNAILGMTELLGETSLSGKQAQFVSISKTAGQSLLDLINGILDLSKAEAGMLELARERFELRSFLEGVVEVLAVSASRKGVGLALDLEADVPGTVEGDPQRLRQVLVNLLGNAVKFTEAGHVVLHVAADPSEESRVLFSVRDTGIGIAPHDCELLFQPFTQVESSSDRRFGGTGLGLNLSQRLVGLMGGRVEVSSVVGYGSTFHFGIELPVPSDVLDRPQTLDAAEGRSVLLIDDCGAERAADRKLLESIGFRVTEADGGMEGIAIWSQSVATGRPFDLVLVDARMPKVPGVEVVRQMVERGITVDNAVLVLPPDLRSDDDRTVESLGLAMELFKPLRRAAVCQVAAARWGAPADGASPAESQDASSRRGAPAEVARVLLVDDSVDNRFLVQCYLKGDRFEVEIAVDGLQAVEKFEAAEFDLVLMDIQLPVLDGYEATRRIRSLERDRGQARTPVLALTADAMPEHRQRALAAGADDHLAKPIGKQALIETMERHLARCTEPEDAGREPGDDVGAPSSALPSDDGVAELGARYLQMRREDAVTLARALALRDFETIARLGHNMKGTGGAYGFPALTEAGARIEAAAHANSAAALEGALGFLDQVLGDLAGTAADRDGAAPGPPPIPPH